MLELILVAALVYGVSWARRTAHSRIEKLALILPCIGFGMSFLLIPVLVPTFYGLLVSLFAQFACVVAINVAGNCSRTRAMRAVIEES